jgi:hypothetical protein
MSKKNLIHAEDRIPFVLNEDLDYDFMRGGEMFPSNYKEVSSEAFGSAYDQAITNLSKAIAKQSEKQLENGFEVDQVKLNLEFKLDADSGRIGLDRSAKIEVVLKPAAQVQVLDFTKTFNHAI